MNVGQEKWETYQKKLATFDFTKIDTTEVDINSIDEVLCYG